MRDPRLFDHTDRKRQKEDFDHVLRYFIFTENIGIVKNKKVIPILGWTVLHWKYRWRKKKSSLFVMRSPIFSETLGFRLLTLYVNPALCLQSMFSLSTSDVSNLCGLQTHGSCFHILFPHPTNKILKKTSLDLSSFLDFNFDGRPIEFWIHSCRGNTVEMNA